MTPDETIAQLRAELIIREDQIAKLTAEHSASWETFYATPLAEARGKLVQLEEDIHTLTDDRNQWQKTADALEKEFARMKEAIINVCSGIDDGGSNFKSVPEMLVALKHREQLSAESRLAAMQKHADALAKALETADHSLHALAAIAPATVHEIYGDAEHETDAALAAYRAFTAEREKEKK